MKSKTYNGKAYADGYAKGNAESAETIRLLKEALNKALAENLAMRPTMALESWRAATSNSGSW